VLIGHEELMEYVVYKDRPIGEEWFFEGASFIQPRRSDGELDPNTSWCSSGPSCLARSSGSEVLPVGCGIFEGGEYGSHE
jgi:hypothetical protein